MKTAITLSSSALCALLLLGCASTSVAPANPVLPAQDPNSPYNQGVAAFRVQNYPEAYRDWSEAAKTGDTTTLNNLGYLVYYGLGTEAQPERAVALWRTAAEQGQSESQWHLGNAYADGIGVKQDRIAAYAWYRCAIAAATARARDGANTPEDKIADDARKSLAQLTDKLDQNEVEIGTALAAEYIDHYVPGPPAAAAGKH